MSHIAALYERPKYYNLTELDQHVTEMMVTTANQFYNFPASGFLIILQNANMVASVKVNCVMSPSVCGRRLCGSSLLRCALVAAVPRKVLTQYHDRVL